MEQVILFKNGQKISLLANDVESPSLKPIDLSPAALKAAYNGLAEAMNTLDVHLKIVPEQEYWIGWDLCREAYIEIFQKQNRELLPGTLIGAIKQ